MRIPAYEAGGRQEGRWVLARDLRAGDAVLLRDGRIAPAESVHLADVVEQVYNFHVAELQNYAVGGCGILVHNQNDPPTPMAGSGSGIGGIAPKTPVALPEINKAVNGNMPHAIDQAVARLNLTDRQVIKDELQQLTK